MKISKFFAYLIPFWKEECLVLLLSLTGIVLGLANPYLAKLIIDKAYGNRDFKLFIILIAIGGLIFILNGIVTGLGGYLSRYIYLRINFGLNRKVFKKLQGLPYSVFQDGSTGGYLYRISYDVEIITRFVAITLPQIISLVPKTLFIIAIISYLNWKMALFSLMLIPLFYVLPLYFINPLRKRITAWVKNSEGIFIRLQEAFSHMQLIKAFGKEGNEMKGYIKNLKNNFRFNLKVTKSEILISFTNNLASRVISGLIVFYGGYQLIKGQMTLGSLSAIAIYFSQLSGLQNSFAYFLQEIPRALVSHDRLEGLFKMEAAPLEKTGIEDAIFPAGKMEFKVVTFGYKEDKTIFEDLSFSIQGGSFIALVGPSGCGKTTIINLIARLFRPLSGEILIDGFNISDVKAEAFYKQIGIALQEPFLWNDTIENNIRYAKENVAFGKIKEAARAACIDDFVNTLPKGYATVIGENACKLSEGQKQRIAISRALIKRPKVLMLDEAMSSLDSITETRVIKNIKEARKDITIIVVSHRLSTVMSADLAYFINSPREIAIGEPKGLLEKNKEFYNLFAAQLKRPPLNKGGVNA
jgi:ATP-binding cassette subfamily B protein